jgi:hypothetical protein
MKPEALKQDLQRDACGTTALQEVDRLVEIDAAALRENEGGCGVAAGTEELLAPPGDDFVVAHPGLA